MAKYDPLARHLASTGRSRISLQFDEIVAMVGGLPRSAFEHRAWWSNEGDGQHVQARAWIAAGYLVDDVNVIRQIVTFRQRTTGRGLSVRLAPAMPATRAEPVLVPSLRQELFFGFECAVCLREMHPVGNRLARLAELIALLPPRLAICCCCLQRAPRELRADPQYQSRWQEWWMGSRWDVCQEVRGPLARSDLQRRIRDTATRADDSRYSVCTGCWQKVGEAVALRADYRERWNRRNGS